MLLPRAAWLPMITAFTFLAACSGSHHASPDSSSTTLRVASTTSASTTSTTSATSTTSTSTTSTSTSAAPSSVRILSLTGPRSPVDCNAETSIQLFWKIRGATKVELRIDGGSVFATFGDGDNQPLVPLACDGQAHTYLLTARAANGQIATKTFKLTEHALVS